MARTQNLDPYTEMMYGAAKIRMAAMTTDKKEKAQIIHLGTTAWAFGVTPEMMEVFGRIASSMRVTGSDIAQLEIHGIANRLNRKPWLDAKDGEVWEITVNGETILCSTDVDGDFTPISRHPYWAKIANGSNKITAGRRVLIWREPEAEEPTETVVAYANAYRALQELFVAVTGKEQE